MFDDIDWVAGAIGLVVILGILIVIVIGVLCYQDKEIELEKYKIEMQYKYNQINVAEE